MHELPVLNVSDRHLRTDRALIQPDNGNIEGPKLGGDDAVETAIGGTLIVADETSDARDFDFLHGTWRIVNERLLSRLSNCDEWERFEAEGTCVPILGGIGNVDSFRPLSGDWQGFEGASLRIFNPQSGLWSIYWADNVLCGLTPPVIGRFRDNVGEFFGDDTHDGTPVRVRFRWSGISPTTARWEQAFSADGGVSWERNWTMAFTREDAR